MFYFAMSTTVCSYAIYLLKFHRALHRASRRSCVSRVAFSHNHSFCWSCNDQILASVLKIFYYLCSRMPAPVLNGTLWLPTSLYSWACCRAWPYGGAARHGPESCGDQLPICSARSIIASVRPSYRRASGSYII